MKKLSKKHLLLSLGFGSASIITPAFTSFNNTTSDNLVMSNLELSDNEMDTILSLKADGETYKGTYKTVIPTQQELTSRVTSSNGAPIRNSFTVGWTDLISKNSGITQQNSNNFWGVQIPHALGQSLVDFDFKSGSMDWLNPTTNTWEQRYFNGYWQTASTGVKTQKFSLPYEISFEDGYEEEGTKTAYGAAENLLLTLLGASLNKDDQYSGLSFILGDLMKNIVPTVAMGVEEYVREDPDGWSWDRLLSEPLGFIEHLFVSQYQRVISRFAPRPVGDMIADFVTKPNGKKAALEAGLRDLIRLPIQLGGDAILSTLFSFTDNEAVWKELADYEDFFDFDSLMTQPSYRMQYQDYLDNDETLKTLFYYRSRDYFIKNFKITNLKLNVNMVEQGNVLNNDLVSINFWDDPDANPDFRELGDFISGEHPIIGGNLVEDYRLFYDNIEISWDYEFTPTRDRFNPDLPETWYEGIDDYEPL